MSKQLENNIITIVLLIVFSWFLYTSLGYSAKARLVPLPVATVSIILILVQIYIQNFAKHLELSVDPTELFKSATNEKAVERVEDCESQKAEQKGGNELVGIGMVFLFVAMIYLLGIINAITIFVFGYFYLIGKEKWYKALLYTLICSASIFVLFVLILHVQLNDPLIVKFFLG